MAGIFGGLNELLFGKAPQYQAPEMLIGEEDINKLIDATRSLGRKNIMDTLGQSQRQATEFLAGQGLSDTGGIPMQMWGNVQKEAFGRIGNLETSLLGQRFDMMSMLQQMLNQQAAMKYQSDVYGYQSGKGFGESLLDIGGMFGLSKLLNKK